MNDAAPETSDDAVERVLRSAESRAGVARFGGGDATSIQRDGLGRIMTITDPLTNQLVYTYDANGDLETFTDREENTTGFAYHPEFAHYLASIEDPLGRKPIRNEYYPDGRLWKHIDAFGKQIVYSHDVSGREEIDTDRLNGIRRLIYDERGNVLEETDPEGKTVVRTYDARNNRLTETDALEWRDRLGDEFPLVHGYLRTTGALAQSVDCPSPGGEYCPRKVLDNGDGTYRAVCQSPEVGCETLTLTKADISVLALNRARLAADLARLFELQTIEMRSLRAPAVLLGKHEISAGIGASWWRPWTW